jgi:hexosaminidase
MSTCLALVVSCTVCLFTEVTSNGHLGDPIDFENSNGLAISSQVEAEPSLRSHRIIVRSKSQLAPERAAHDSQLPHHEGPTRRVRYSKLLDHDKNLLPLVPYPVHVTRLSGSYELTLPIPVSAISLDQSHTKTDFAASAMNALNESLELFERDGQTNPNGLHLVLDPSLDAGDDDEAYALLAKLGAPLEIRARGAAGLFYGVQTLLQLVNTDNIVQQQRRVNLPAVEIKDQPRFKYRGLMVDTGRHFFRPDDLKSLIATMASQKYNRLHWHITDDQGWRLPVENWPKLIEVGSGVQEAHLKPTGILARPEKPYYTLDEIKDLVDYASERHIEIIPEVDIPGHVTPALVAYPELGNDDVPGWKPPTKLPMEHYIGEKVWGVYDQTLQPSEKSLNFVKDVVKTIAKLFPSQYVHIGGDEAPSKEWEKSPRAKTLLHERDLSTTQSFFTKAVSEILAHEGKTPMAWDEVIGTGGAPDGLVVTAWRSSNELHKALRRGKAISSVSDFLYLDRYQTFSPNEPRAQPGHVSLSKVYNYDPSSGLTGVQSENLLGVQGQLWSEYLTDFKQLEYMAHPRSYALAELAWSPRFHSAGGGYTGFLERLTARCPDLSRRGVKYHVIQ